MHTIIKSCLHIQILIRNKHQTICQIDRTNFALVQFAFMVYGLMLVLNWMCWFCMCVNDDRYTNQVVL